MLLLLEIASFCYLYLIYYFPQVLPLDLLTHLVFLTLWFNWQLIISIITSLSIYWPQLLLLTLLVDLNCHSYISIINLNCYIPLLITIFNCDTQLIQLLDFTLIIFYTLPSLWNEYELNIWQWHITSNSWRQRGLCLQF